MQGSSFLDRRPPAMLCSVTQEPGHGGIARVARLVWQVLQEVSGSQCKLITLIPRGLEPPKSTDKLRFAAKVVRKLINHDVDWIIFDHLSLARVQRLVPRAFRRPYAVLLYSIEAWSPLSPKLKEILRQARVRIAISHYTAKRVSEVNPEIGPIDVCHLALLPIQYRIQDASEENPLVATDPDPDWSPVKRIQSNSVLIVGRMFSTERYKGHDHLIGAWPDLKARVPDAQLVIVGRGDDVPRLRAKAEQTGSGASILFTGQVSESTLQAIYKQVSVFAMPSRNEGFGLVYLEAMQHRLPCIGSIHDAAAEVIEDGVTGFLVDQTDKNSLVDALARLLENPAQRRQMGEAGFERFQKEFSFEQFKERFLTALKPLMSEGIASI